MKSFHSVFLALLAVFTLLPTGCETPDSPQEPSGPVAVESVTVSPQNLELKVGETATLTARIQPSNAQGTLSWTSSNTAVASVANGTVTAVAAGSATITASAGGKSASCQVTVKATQTVVEVESVTLDRHELTLKEGETNRLVATVSPSNATDKTISWATSNPAIVSVDKEGNVKGVAVGTATVAASHGNLSDACKITVTASAVPVTSISLDKTTLALAEQDTYQLTATVKPDNATDKTVTWSTANAAIATVSDNGLVTAVAEGTTTITAKAGDKTATCSVTVSKKVIPVTSVSLNKTSLALTEQETFQLSATVSPDNATDKTVTWSSSNTAVATVDGGKVTAVAPGTATITAKAGDKTATCAVTVNQKIVDTSGPAIVSFDFTPEKVNVADSGQNVTFTIHLTDETGVKPGFSISLFHPEYFLDTMRYIDFKLKSGDKKDGIYEAVATIEKGAPAGNWTVGLSGLEDELGYQTFLQQQVLQVVHSQGNTEPIVDNGEEHGWD